MYFYYYSSKRFNYAVLDLKLVSCLSAHNIDGSLSLPVNGAAVDERREHSASRPESISDRRHAQDYMEVLPDAEWKQNLQVTPHPYNHIIIVCFNLKGMCKYAYTGIILLHKNSHFKNKIRQH